MVASSVQPFGIVYMHDFPRPSFLCRTALFADDIEFHNSANSVESASRVLQPYLNRIDSWSKDWRLELSIDKCALLVFSRKRWVDNQLKVFLNNLPIPIV